MNSPTFYETEKALSDYLLFHYGSAQEVMPWPLGPLSALDYPSRCVSECLETASLPVPSRALDLGCAVGRSTFELARHCTEVVGIDYSHRFIQVAQQIQQTGSIPYTYVEEGLLTRSTTASTPTDIDRKRVRFQQGDAQALPGDIGTFDVILMANLIDRLQNPHRCLDALASLVNPGGQLILTTPYTWLEEYTPLPHWLGGFQRNGFPVRTLDTLRTLLDPNFVLTRILDLPFLIREHARKFQWSVAQATVWIRR